MLRLSVLVAAIGIVALSISPAFAVKVPTVGISQSIDDDPLRTIESVTFSPDGQNLLFVGNLTSGTNFDYAYTVPLSGGTPTQVSDGTLDVDYVARFTPDGSSIVYAADTGPSNSLLKVPAGGGAATTITNEDVRFFHLTPDSQTAVFLSRPTGSTPDILRTVPLAGGAVTDISTPAQGDIDRASWNLSPDGQTAIFASTFANPGSGNEDTLFSVPVDGSMAPTEVNFGPTAPHIIDIEDVALTDDGRAVFITDYTVNGNYDLHFVPQTGGTASLLPDLDLPSGADLHNFTISPDGNFVAFSSDYQTVNLFELFVVPITGGTPVKVSDEITAEAIDLDITGDGIPDISDGNIDGNIEDGEGTIAWSPNGSKIAYIADGELDEIFELYLVDNPLFEPVVGDYNGDGLVDAADYTVWRDTLTSTTDLRADGDGSGTVDPADYTLWVNNFGNPSSAISVPEPSALALIAIVLCGYAVRRNGRS